MTQIPPNDPIFSAHPDLQRMGPRPLALHLSTAFMTYQSLAISLPLLFKDQAPPVPFHRAVEKKGKKLLQNARNLPAKKQQDLQNAVHAQIKNNLNDLIAGLRIYHAHPYARESSEAQTIWQDGAITLQDYAPDMHTAPIVFLVPSLVNKSYILDLMPERSFIRFLKQSGFRPILLDWGTPGAVESEFDFADYCQRMILAFDAMLLIHPHATPAILGYCMGGLFAAALAQSRPKQTGKLLLIATPWDFAKAYDAPEKIDFYLQNILPSFTESRFVPIDMLQSMFYDLDPWLVVRKFQKLGRGKQTDRELRHFIALEDWINDGVPLSYSVMQTALNNWYKHNELARGKYKLLGKPFDARKIKNPALLLIPHADRIVPPQSALALAKQLPNAKTMRAKTGHIGLMASAYAQREIWPKLVKWLKTK